MTHANLRNTIEISMSELRDNGRIRIKYDQRTSPIE